MELPLTEQGTPPPNGRLTKPILSITAYGRTQISEHWLAKAMNACAEIENTETELKYYRQMFGTRTDYSAMLSNENNRLISELNAVKAQRDELLAMFEEVVALGNHGDVNNSIKFKALAVRTAEERLNTFKKKHFHETPAQS